MNKLFFFTLIILGCVGCHSPEKKNNELSDNRTFIKGKKRPKMLLEVSTNDEDIPVNDYLTATLAPIRANFKRINSVKEWSLEKSHDLFESTEGGLARFYYHNGTLEKIIEQRFGETGQLLREYYLMEGELSFVFEKDMHYNRPIYWDEKHKKENNDTEVFDIEKSEVTEERSYFKNEKLIHQIVSEDCGSPFAEEYLREEEKRLLDTYNDLLKLEK